jgi:hypothetical protein
MEGIQTSFGTVLWIVTGAGLVFGFLALISSGKQWEDYGRGGLSLDRDSAGVRAVGDLASPAAIRERDDEIREFLEARNARRRRRGELPIDVEAELRRLTGPVIDEGLRAEIRDLVIARNHRRARAGKPQLDVAAEIEREIAGLSDLG